MPKKKEKVKINPIWYALPVIEIIGFFTPARWLGAVGSIMLFLVLLAASIASIVGFFLIRKKSFPIALINLIVGAIIFILLSTFFLIGFLVSLTT